MMPFSLSAEDSPSPRYVPEDVIDRLLDILHTSKDIPTNPTVEPVFRIPPHLAERSPAELLTSETMQELTEHMSHFLRLLFAPKVTLGIESSDFMLATPQQGLTPECAGLYTVRRPGEREIHLTKKLRFGFHNVLAILAHEVMHYYLDSKGMLPCPDADDELLADVATAYLGMGQILVKGYDSIVFSPGEPDGLSLEPLETRVLTLGYVPSNTMGYAICRAARLRNQRAFIPTAPLLSRPGLYLHFWLAERRNQSR